MFKTTDDFVAHGSAVNCLKISPKSGRIMATAGEDRRVNLWTVGKTAPILSLVGHASSVESVTMDWPEEIVVAGSSSGTIKLWDLEHAKVIRTLAGHKSSATCVEFHPFGEFFASGSTDATVKIWDVRRKGCIQTYTGHQDAMKVLRITPDGRWIVTGSAEGTVKLWDMTAGKLLKTYSEASTPIAGLCFNPAEFMMATLSTEGVVRFYDLQTLELISQTPEVGGVPRAITFHPEGGEVLVACEDSLQVWTWEPPKCHEVVPLRWGNVADMHVSDDSKMVAGSLNQNFVNMWGVDLSLVRPYKKTVTPAPSGAAAPKTPIATEKPSSSSTKRSPSESASEPKPTTTSQPKTLSKEMRGKDSKLESITAQKSSFISTGNGDRPLNLDISRFISDPQTAKSSTPVLLSPDERSTTPTDDDIIDSLQLRHTSILSILTNRLHSIKAIAEVWDEHNTRPSIEVLTITCRDPAVWVDILRVLSVRPKLMTLEVAGLLLPILNELLFEVYEE
ncbi:hypothetical protein HDV05_005065 [Chytridiales sp. JEL 0842]|nr:hypothetical protein HDV05_005065 [Chytridiales sp. JEL 0842]